MLAAESNVFAGSFAVMITNGGPHDPEALARNVLRQLIHIVPAESDRRALEQMALADRLLNVLAKHFRGLQEQQRLALLRREPVSFEIGPLVADVEAAAAGTPWADLFRNQQDAIADLLRREYRTVASIEQQWFSACR